MEEQVAGQETFSYEEFESGQAAEIESAKPRKVRGMNDHGFRNDSDSAIIIDLLIAGGLDRQDINEKVAESIVLETRSGRKKNIPSLISGLLARVEARGYRIESSWRLLPPEESTEEPSN